MNLECIEFNIARANDIITIMLMLATVIQMLLWIEVAVTELDPQWCSVLLHKMILRGKSHFEGLCANT